MKYIFKIAMLILLAVLLYAVLRNNKEAVQFEIDHAKTVIDSIPVRVFHLKMDSVSYQLQTVGQVRSDDEIYVVSKAAGDIQKVHSKIGEQVKRGAIIAQIDDYFTKQEYKMAEMAYDKIKKDHDRYAELAREGAVTQKQMEEIKLQLDGAQTKMNSLKQRLKDYLITAPVSGTVNQLFVSRGNTVGPGSPICELVGGSMLKIEAKINPENTNKLTPGVKATITGDFGHGESYHGELSEIGEKAGKFGGVAAVFILSPEENKSLKIGSIVNISVDIKGNQELLLPRTALTNEKGEMGLFVLQQNNRVKFTTVKYKNFNETYITVLNGELEDKMIVVEGNYMLEPEDLVKVIR